MLFRGVTFGEDGHLFSRWKWAIAGAFSLGVVLFEFIEHQLIFKKGFLDADFLRDVFFYGIVAFFAGMYFSGKIEQLSLDYQRSRSTSANLQNLIEHLTEAQDVREVSIIYIQALRSILPIEGAQLLLYDSNNESYHRLASWSENNIQLPRPVPQHDIKDCQTSVITLPTGRFSPSSCSCTGETQDGQLFHRSCVPITTGNDQLLGILYLHHSEELHLSPDQEKLLHIMTSEITGTLERIKLQERLYYQKDSQTNIQQRIARDVHDTLGHNLAYLRLKLTQIPGEYHVGSEVILQDLIHLQETANEAYQQMRDLLVALTPDENLNLRLSFSKYAQRVADRAGFELDTEFKGETRALHRDILQHIILILREVLGNIEKHAFAQHVRIYVDWQESGLFIQVVDDGCGFDSSTPPSERQLGLRFMRERVSEIQGDLTIESILNSGTKVSLWIPYPKEDG